MMPLSPVVPLGYVQNLVQRLAASDHPVGEVAAIETGDETTRIAKLQLRDDVLPHAIGGGGSQCHHRCLRKTAAQRGDLPVLRAKVVAPLADAVGLVDGDQPGCHSARRSSISGSISRSGATYSKRYSPLYSLAKRSRDSAAERVEFR